MIETQTSLLKTPAFQIADNERTIAFLRATLIGVTPSDWARQPKGASTVRFVFRGRGPRFPYSPWFPYGAVSLWIEDETPVILMIPWVGEIPNCVVRNCSMDIHGGRVVLGVYTPLGSVGVRDVLAKSGIPPVAWDQPSSSSLSRRPLRA